jgi:hypothetical protein
LAPNSDNEKKKFRNIGSRNEDRWSCNFCPKVLGSEKSLIYHLLTRHKALAEHLPQNDTSKLVKPKRDPVTILLNFLRS